MSAVLTCMHGKSNKILYIIIEAIKTTISDRYLLNFAISLVSTFIWRDALLNLSKPSLLMDLAS